MTHSFDSGLTRSRRELLQDKIASLLQPFLISQPGGFLEAIEPITFAVGHHDEDSFDALETVLSGRAPAVAIAPLGLRGSQAGGQGHALAELDVELYIVSRNRRSEVDGRARYDVTAAADDTVDPGVFAMLELVWARLFDVDLRPATSHPLKRVSEEPIATTPKMTIWRQTWRVQLTCDADLARGITQKFTVAASKAHLQPGDPSKAEIDITTTVG